MRFEIVTIFPGFFSGFLENGVLRRALAAGLVEIGVHDLRAFTHDRHRSVDDRPFGGGEGMVLKALPLAEALESLGVAQKAGGGEAADRPEAVLEENLEEHPSGAKAHIDFIGLVPGINPRPTARASSSATDDVGAPRRPTVILLSAQGRRFTQALAREIAGLERVVLVCGRYEGVDERINELYCDMELSIGDYVVSGGELAAAVVIDAAMRLLPGVLGNEASSEFESFGVADGEITTDAEGVPRSQHGAGGLLDYPHYTRPAEFAGLKVPEPLMNGDHQAIRRWRREQQLRKTLTNRPDLLEKAALSKDDRALLERMREN